MGAKISVLGLIMSFLPYLRSAMVRFPLSICRSWIFNILVRDVEKMLINRHGEAGAVLQTAL